jgi:hypothetical protein
MGSVNYNVNKGISAIYEAWILCNKTASKLLSIIAFCNGKHFRNISKIGVMRLAVIGRGNLNIVNKNCEVT